MTVQKHSEKFAKKRYLARAEAEERVSPSRSNPEDHDAMTGGENLGVSELFIF